MSDYKREVTEKLETNGHRYGIVVARFNESITERLLEGALDGLKTHGVEKSAVNVARVPGAFELPIVAKKMAESKKYDAIICLGAVIRGGTAHFDFVAGQAAEGILRASLGTNVPIIFSVLTTENVRQAEERIGIGYSGALSAIEMVNLLKNLNLGLSSSDSEEFAPSDLAFSTEGKVQETLTRSAEQKNAREASKVPEAEGVRP